MSQRGVRAGVTLHTSPSRPVASLPKRPGSSARLSLCQVQREQKLKEALTSIRGNRTESSEACFPPTLLRRPSDRGEPVARPASEPRSAEPAPLLWRWLLPVALAFAVGTVLSSLATPLPAVTTPITVSGGTMLWRISARVEHCVEWLWHNRDHLLLAAWIVLLAFLVTGRLLGYFTHDGQVIAKTYEQFCVGRLSTTGQLAQLSPSLSVAFDQFCRLVDGVVYSAVLLLLEWIVAALYLTGKILEISIWLCGLILYDLTLRAIDVVPRLMGLRHRQTSVERVVLDSAEVVSSPVERRPFIKWETIVQFFVCCLIYEGMARIAVFIL